MVSLLSCIPFAAEVSSDAVSLLSQVTIDAGVGDQQVGQQKVSY